MSPSGAPGVIQDAGKVAVGIAGTLWLSPLIEARNLPPWAAFGLGALLSAFLVALVSNKILSRPTVEFLWEDARRMPVITPTLDWMLPQQEFIYTVQARLRAESVVGKLILRRLENPEARCGFKDGSYVTATNQGIVQQGAARAEYGAMVLRMVDIGRANYLAHCKATFELNSTSSVPSFELPIIAELIPGKRWMMSWMFRKVCIPTLVVVRGGA